MGILDELYIRKKIRKILQEKKKDDSDSDTDKGDGKTARIVVTVADLTERDGVYYMVHTLNGGINAGALDLGGWGADITKGQGGVEVALTKGKKGVKGKGGRGRVKQAVKEAGALASENPGQLMKKLGNPTAAGDTVPEKVLNFIRNSIYGNKTMTKAYSGARIKN